MGTSDCGIYKISSPSGKIYIGQSIQLKKRESTYKQLHCKSQSRLFNSFKKYGVDNHLFEVVELCEAEILNEKERYWQDYFEVLGKNGLNCKLTETNNKSGKYSDEVKKKMSDAKLGKPSNKKGKKLSEDTKKKISENNGCKRIEVREKISKTKKGHTVSVETKKKLSEAAKSQWERKKLIT